MMEKFKVIAVIFIAALFFGAGCAKEIGPLSSNKLRRALDAVAEKFQWQSAMERLPEENNFFGKSYVIYGPAKEDGLESVINNIEIIEFETAAYAAIVYKAEDCIKIGKGLPRSIYGMDACCLNDQKKGRSRVVMARDNYIFRSDDYFHADCGAEQYLKKFWSEYSSNLKN